MEKKNSFVIVLLVLFVGFHSQADMPYPDDLFKHPWVPEKGYVSSEVNLAMIQKMTVELKCGSRLYPTHASQYLKKYHVYDFRTIDPNKVEGDSYLCKKAVQKPHANGHWPCIVGDTRYRTVISDTYRDSCGNLYRGYQEKVFFKKEESMGTLFSVGRVVYEVPHVVPKGQFVPGSTFSVPYGEFHYLTPLFEGDEAEIERLQKMEESTFEFDPELLIYRSKK